jgi:HTH-type transcriptional regulator/antitoxin HigA
MVKTISFDNDFLPAWSKVIKNLPLSRIRSKRQYDLMVKAMEYLADLVDDNSKHPLVGLLEILEMLVEDYDRVHNQIPPISAVERLNNIMVEHDLKQTDLQEIGSQGVISEILSGKRRINKRHAMLLAKRFSLPEKLFLD